MIRWRRLKTELKGVFCQDKWIEESRLVKKEVFKFFSNKMSMVEDFGVRLDNIVFQ